MIEFAFVSTVDGIRLVNAKNEKDAYQAVIGEAMPENGPADNLEWDCQLISLESGEQIDPGHYI